MEILVKKKNIIIKMNYTKRKTVFYLLKIQIDHRLWEVAMEYHILHKLVHSSRVDPRIIYFGIFHLFGVDVEN